MPKMRVKAKKPLYRKLNTTAHGACCHRGPDYAQSRNTKAERRGEKPAVAMHRGKRRGRDYTPLFRFLLSRVGEDWDVVFQEAQARLDTTEPIFWLVANAPHEQSAVVRVGESSYFNGLFVDEDNRLRMVDPTIGPETMEPSCACCTHTLNGVPFTRPFVAPVSAAAAIAAQNESDDSSDVA